MGQVLEIADLFVTSFEMDLEKSQLKGEDQQDYDAMTPVFDEVEAQVKADHLNSYGENVVLVLERTIDLIILSWIEKNRYQNYYVSSPPFSDFSHQFMVKDDKVQFQFDIMTLLSENRVLNLKMVLERADFYNQERMIQVMDNFLSQIDKQVKRQMIHK